jgi:hypothetical protein
VRGMDRQTRGSHMAGPNDPPLLTADAMLVSGFIRSLRRRPRLSGVVKGEPSRVGNSAWQ